MDLATVDKLLTTTRSVRKRLDLTRPVEPEVIQQCLDMLHRHRHPVASVNTISSWLRTLQSAKV